MYNTNTANMRKILLVNDKLPRQCGSTNLLLDIAYEKVMKGDTVLYVLPNSTLYNYIDKEAFGDSNLIDFKVFDRIKLSGLRYYDWVLCDNLIHSDVGYLETIKLMGHHVIAMSTVE